MDSEHRHELEENVLAGWLAKQVEEIKPHLPAIGVGAVLLVAALVGWNGYRRSAENAKAERWRDFAVAIEGAQPNEEMLQQAIDANPGTAVAEWAEVTWADGKLYDAANNFFRNRAEADKSVEQAIGVYERLVSADDRNVAERANFQLGRALELQGKLEEAREQYARVTGAFAAVAKNRSEQLESKKVQESYQWITATKNGPAPSDNTGGLGDFEPDDIALPEVNAADADATLQDLLDTVEEEVDSAADAESAGEMTESPAEGDTPQADFIDDRPAEPEPPAEDASAKPTPADE